MGMFASLTSLSPGPLLDTASSVQQFVRVFVGIYILLIFIYVLLSWVRIPYSRTFSAVEQFLDEVVNPYLRLFRGRIPTLGPIDVTPIVAVVVLLVAAELVNFVIAAVL
jgi:YggT family protein